jgi:YbgC/YbaW family acyl-CoA thioester hydrolase
VRRVRSHRRYEVLDGTGALCADARTDWVYVDAASGRPRRVPQEVITGLGLPPDGAPAERPAWSAPPPPVTPPRVPHRVRFSELDSLGHMNNATYLDVLVDATLDVLASLDWPLDRMVAHGSLPAVVGGDIEYLDAARYGDALETATWFAAAAGGVDVHQTIARAGESRPLVQATTRWQWSAGTGTAATPAALLAALQPVAA